MKKLMILLPMLMGTATAQDFLVSFGDGGVKYRIVDSTCYSYVLNYPKDEKRLPDMLNNTIISSVVKAGREYSKKANGFFNVKFFWQVVGKERIIVQVCGDIVRRE